MPKICNLPGVHELCKLIFGFADDHLPLDDLDGDGFSTLKTFRGSDWRGRDCAPFNADHYPGRVPIDGDRAHDSNCNGIVGTNPRTGVPYEEELCAGIEQLGVAVLGDSAAAHFSIPPQYLDATRMGPRTFANVERNLENEFDWPMLSATTAYFNSTAAFSPDIGVTVVNSTYMVMRGRNRCVHRDFQNLGVNGARSGAMNATIQAGLSRTAVLDKPLWLLYALIGNDVCNGHEDTLAHMTSAKDFRANMEATMAFLHTRLPKGSHVFTMGLADGKVLWDSMHARQHPLGVSYRDVYGFLNCLSISPCRGWMTANETLRNATQDHANLLSSVVKSVAAVSSTANVTVHYLENPIDAAVRKWVARGGEPWQLIEPVDGFHPNQIANSLITEVVWDHMQALGALPPINPNNAEIGRLFGDQGGY